MARSITSKDYMKIATITTSAIIGTLLVFGLFAYFMQGENPPAPELQEMLMYVVALAVAGGFAAGNIVFKTIITSAKSAPLFKEKLRKYQTALLIRTACLEAPGMLGAVALILTGDVRFLLAIVAVVPVMIYYRPSIASVVIDLDLPDPERMMLENADTVLYTVDDATGK